MTDLHALHVPIPRQRILHRLQYRTRVEASAELMRQVDRYIQHAAALCNRLARVRHVPVVVDGSMVRIGDWEAFESQSLSHLLRESDTIAIMGASIGAALPEAAHAAMAAGDVMRSVVFDATGSEMAEALAHAAWMHVRRDLARRAGALTRRFSPGYGDVPLELHRDIFAALSLNDWGITLTDRWMFVPEKTTVSLSGHIAAASPEAMRAEEESI